MRRFSGTRNKHSCKGERLMNRNRLFCALASATALLMVAGGATAASRTDLQR